MRSPAARRALRLGVPAMRACGAGRMLWSAVSRATRARRAAEKCEFSLASTCRPPSAILDRSSADCVSARNRLVGRTPSGARLSRCEKSTAPARAPAHQRSHAEYGPRAGSSGARRSGSPNGRAELEWAAAISRPPASITRSRLVLAPGIAISPAGLRPAAKAVRFPPFRWSPSG